MSAQICAAFLIRNLLQSYSPDFSDFVLVLAESLDFFFSPALLDSVVFSFFSDFPLLPAGDLDLDLLSVA